MTLALFDFDGTITTDDSLIKFIRYAVGERKTFFGMMSLSPMLLAYKLKLIPNYEAKEKMLGYFFGGMDELKFQEIAREYSLKKIDQIVRPAALEKIEWHKQEGHKVTIVSASMECWLKPWCERNGIELISTRLERSGGIITGKFDGRNCHGPEKAKRVKKRFILENFEYIYAYGDSSGDKELLELAHDKNYRVF